MNYEIYDAILMTTLSIEKKQSSHATHIIIVELYVKQSLLKFSKNSQMNIKRNVLNKIERFNQV